MNHNKPEDSSTCRDAALVAAMLIMEEFFPHCPNGIASAIQDRLCETIEAAIEAAASVRWKKRSESSLN